VEVTVLTIAMWFGLLWPQIAPLMITPGMTQEQVEAILGKPDGGIFISNYSRDAGWMTNYLGWGVRVQFQGEKVVSINRKRSSK
jgi:hypothetical protein